MVRIRPSVLVLLVLGLLLPQAASAAADTRIIVKRAPGLGAAERRDVRAGAGVNLVETLSLPRTEVVTTDDPQAALQELNADPDVAYAEPDRVRHATALDLWSELWGLDNVGQTGGTADSDIDVPGAWDLLDTPGDGIKVAVVDSGIDLDHADLAGRIAVNPGELVGNGLDDDANGFVDDWRGWDWSGDEPVGDPDDPGDALDHDNDPSDENDHGTHVAGIVAADDDDHGVVGVAPGAELLALRVLDADGSGYDSHIADAFDYAAAQGAQVVNASLGGPGLSQTIRDAIAAHPSVLFVVAAGNDGTNNDVVPQSPCDEPRPNIVCVGASDASDAPACYSNFGRTSVDVFAPGDQIVSTVPLGWVDKSGTSMAAPHVAGIAALMLQQSPETSPATVRAQLIASVDRKPSMSALSVAGGRVNALRALGGPALGTGGGTAICDDDGDDVADQLNDACTGQPGPASNHGCPLPPPPPDYDADGFPDASDGCQTTPGTVNGCPPPTTPTNPPVATPTPTPTPRPPAPAAPNPDRDGDGRQDASDGCPSEGAATADGCPTARVRSLSARAKRRTATVRVRADRAVTARVTVERKRCAKGRRCRWVRVARRTVASRSGSVTVRVKRLKKGSHRVVVRLSSGAGRGQTATRRFRVR